MKKRQAIELAIEEYKRELKEKGRSDFGISMAVDSGLEF